MRVTPGREPFIVGGEDKTTDPATLSQAGRPQAGDGAQRQGIPINIRTARRVACSRVVRAQAQAESYDKDCRPMTSKPGT
jgi:hypothetical protein